jgi:hypothetical protein
MKIFLLPFLISSAFVLNHVESMSKSLTESSRNLTSAIREFRFHHRFEEYDRTLRKLLHQIELSTSIPAVQRAAYEDILQKRKFLVQQAKTPDEETDETALANAFSDLIRKTENLLI